MGQTTSKIEPSKEVSVTLPSQGTLTGSLVTDLSTGQAKAHRYTGVPYALPPTGSLRWRRPVPLPPTHQYDGSYHDLTAICPPPDNYEIPKLTPLPNATVHRRSEDCLHLNIWVPAAPSRRPLPVLFFIHGGWLQVGAAHFDSDQDPSDLLFDGGVECIVVCPGYRLNVFGFLSHQALRDTEGSVGNWGFWDQRAALEWVSRNIAHFGGDLGNVTVAGLSAGAHSAHSQLLHEYELCKKDPSYRPIIRRVFQQSNAAAWPAKTPGETQPQLDELAALFHIPASLPPAEKIEHLRKVPDLELAAKLSSMSMHTFRAVRDEAFVKTSWYVDMASGAFGRWCEAQGISFLIGETDQEESVYERINHPDDAESFVRQLNNYYPLALVRRMVELYGVETGAGDLYAVLGVPASASRAEVRAAYLSLAREHHPDKAGLAPAQHERISRINDAYATLYDDSARQDYDLTLRSRREAGVRIAATLDLDAFTPRDAEAAPLAFTHPCRCGHAYTITALRIEQGIDLIHCDGCSEIVRVLTGELQRIFGIACADSQVYTAERTLVTDLLKGGLDPNALLRYRINFRAPFLDQYLPKEMGVGHSFDNPVWWYVMCGGGWSEKQKETLRQWLKPYAAFLRGEERDQVAKAWYGEQPTDSNGRWLRVLQPDCTIHLSKTDERWEEKQTIITAMQQARQEMLR